MKEKIDQALKVFKKKLRELNAEQDRLLEDGLDDTLITTRISELKRIRRKLMDAKSMANFPTLGTIESKLGPNFIKGFGENVEQLGKFTIQDLNSNTFTKVLGAIGKGAEGIRKA